MTIDMQTLAVLNKKALDYKEGYQDAVEDVLDILWSVELAFAGAQVEFLIKDLTLRVSGLKSKSFAEEDCATTL